MQQNFTKEGLNFSDLLVLEALRNLRDKIPDEFRSVVSLSSQILSRPVLNKFGWLILPSNTAKFNIDKLKLLHELFINYKYIPEDFEYSEFEPHFFGIQIPEEKIMWIGKNYVLPILFDKMQRKEIITFSGNLYDMLVAHFKDSDGELLNRNSLEKQASKGGADVEDRKINKIISFLTC